MIIKDRFNKIIHVQIPALLPNRDKGIKTLQHQGFQQNPNTFWSWVNEPVNMYIGHKRDQKPPLYISIKLKKIIYMKYVMH